MRAVYVPLRADMKDALLTLAARDDRDPRRQAARLLQEGLERAGVLPVEVTDYRVVPGVQDLVVSRPAVAAAG
jgi:hypothetical protein